MTRPDLDALAALLEKATPRPWAASEAAPETEYEPALWRIHGGDTSLEATLAELWSGEHDSAACAALIVAAINALPALIAYVRELEQWQRDMVEKAAANSLDGYRELAACAAAAENERDEARAATLAMRERCAQACEKVRDRSSGSATECAAAIRALEV